MTGKRVLIIGAGQAAAQCAASLRQKKFDGPITIVGDEPAAPYQRPPLSKAFLAGELPAERLAIRPDAFYEKSDIDVRTGLSAKAIDRTAKTVAFTNGEDLSYDALVLATGTRVRKLKIAGSDLPGVHYLRSTADVDGIRPAFVEGARIAIVGAGYIGLEVAAVAAKRGLKVTVVETQDRVMSRVTSPTVSTFFETLHRNRGVDILLNAGCTGFEGDGRLERLRLGDGSAIDCDLAVVGIGVIPNAEIAADAGIEVDDGILVDEFCRTNDENIFAVGDCTKHISNYFGGRLRLESVHNAIEQGKTAALTICGERQPYDQAPWFWSDQYEIKLQTVGISAGRYNKEVVRGDVVENKFSVFYLQDDIIIAVDSISAPADHMVSRRLIAEARVVDAEALADPSNELKSFLAPK